MPLGVIAGRAQTKADWHIARRDVLAILGILCSTLFGPGCLLPEVTEVSVSTGTQRTTENDPKKENASTAQESAVDAGNKCQNVEGTCETVEINRPSQQQQLEPAGAAGITARGSTAGASATAGAAKFGGSAGMTSECVEGQARCALDHVSRERCTSGSWKIEPCDSDAVCSSDSHLPNGSCVRKSPECIGHAGKHLCDAQGNLLECTSQEVLESRTVCGEKRLCNAAATRCELDECRAGEQRCLVFGEDYQIDRCLVRDAPAEWVQVTQCPQDKTCRPGDTMPACR